MSKKDYCETIDVSTSNVGMSCPCCGDPWGKMREVVYDDEGHRLKEIYCANCVQYFKLRWH